MKKLDKLIITAMLPPYLLAFFVAEFVLVMQFLWKYIDEIIGKGISFFVLMELIFYFAVTIIPLAIPLTILISSVMVFGNLGERYELSSMKSAGISLLRIMAAAILLSVFTAGFSFVASNYLKPKANYKFYYRFNSVRKQKPSLSISPQVFNNDFKDMVMRVGEKDSDGKTVKDVMIYDHSKSDKSEVHLITAKDGEMYSTDDGKLFIIKLFDGIQYGDVKKSNTAKKKKSKNQFVRTEFSEWNKVFDMSQFEMEASNLNLSRKSYDLMNTFQLNAAIDSFGLEIDSLSQSSNQIYTWYKVPEYLAITNGTAVSKETTDIDTSNIQRHSTVIQDSLRESLKVDSIQSRKAQERFNDKERLKEKISSLKKARPPSSKKKRTSYVKQEVELTDSMVSIIQLYTAKEQKVILDLAKNETKRLVEKQKVSKSKVASLSKDKNKHVLRFHQQYSWAMICIIFLFIGAPLGSIVKKGGYGYPLLFAILFFMLFIIVNILGEKLNKGGNVGPIIGAWLPCIILTPFAVYLTYKALNDSSFKEFQFIRNGIAKLKNLRKVDSIEGH